MSTLDVTVPHRLGRRTSFIPGLQGRPAQWADVTDAARDPARRAAVAEAATATVLAADAAGRALVGTADLHTLASTEPDRLYAVRRPASHKGMRNYISRVAVPSTAGPKAVWCESFNELSHLRDLLLLCRPVQVTTQPFRLEWVFVSGVRSHVPDFLMRHPDGRTLLVDVTTESKLDDPRVAAILRLTGGCAAAMGWDYEVRTEMPPQRIRNINFIHAGRGDVEQDRPASARVLRTAGGTLDVQRAAELLGDRPQGYARLWDLVAHGLVYVPLERPIDLDTLVLSVAPKECAPWRRPA